MGEKKYIYNTQLTRLFVNLAEKRREFDNEANNFIALV